MALTSVDDFYREVTTGSTLEKQTIFPQDVAKEIGHFNVFSIEDLFQKTTQRSVMPYNRRTYYKISLIRGRNRAEYADKVLDIETNALLFASPKVPYHYVPLDEHQAGYFCIFTDAFLLPSKSGVILDELPIFRPGGIPIFQLSDEKADQLNSLFLKMREEITSDYAYKYDLLRTYVLELIHYGQKLQPLPASSTHPPASARVTSLFLELLERQFPIDTLHQKVGLRTAKDFADHLAVHVNHLNKVLKETLGQTTTEAIQQRILQEAKILLKQTNWTVSEIAYCLGFEQVAHFSNFFRKQTSFSPLAFRA
ncbi:AraC family transcriptional regulator [Siphonobacter sp. BAB-5385]|uniref:helix-turn-helix domain-containing protein n=1 Tax=Siphonobacter sp. BAB-5385 TaxID=1864822 RepID=UPI000B9DF270|nr:AraC family transcriptional regulator [Siphonobacter sp. BAB-5385]OZI06876.1 AraC family transcriptional regulator [Siphonobacter sp. BAB-5385]